MKRIQNLYNKVEYIVYISCILLIIAICILMYADGIVRDEYNIAIDGIRLRQNLLIIVIYMGLFLALRRVLKSRCMMTIILFAFIPVSFYSFTTISTNTVAIKKIVDEKEYKKTGIEKIHLADLKDILAKKKSATIYIGREDCPACRYIFPKLEMYVYKKQIGILTYNTIEDRDTNREELMKVLEMLNVDTVPIILEIEDGVVSNSYRVEEILEKYIEKESGENIKTYEN